MQKVYEIMFIVDQSLSTNFAQVEKEIKKIMARYNATVISLEKWGDKKLAYPIRKAGQKHIFGTYVLGYFQIAPEEVKHITHDLRMSEMIVRFLILCHKGEIKKVPFIKDEISEIETF